MTYDHSDVTEAARLLREVLDLTRTGNLVATSAHARVLVRRLEGAVAALEALTETATEGQQQGK